jgi:glycosyltransferase involved in cell wall biosynthesis
MSDSLKIAALVPVYNEAETLGPLLERLLPFVERVLIVDDGSTDGSADVAASWQLRQSEKIRLHSRPNGGKGRALRTGAELVIGTRRHQKEGYPKARRRANAVGDWWISKILKHPVQDAQSGYRLYETGMLRRLELHEDGFAIETELLVRMLRLGGRIAYVPIPAIYEGVGSYFRPIMDTYNICVAFSNALEHLRDDRGWM